MRWFWYWYSSNYVPGPTAAITNTDTYYTGCYFCYRSYRILSFVVDVFDREGYMILLVIILIMIRLLWCFFDHTDRLFFYRVLVMVLLLWPSRSMIQFRFSNVKGCTVASTTFTGQSTFPDPIITTAASHTTSPVAPSAYGPTLYV